jgi:hypothetical protein
MLSDFRLASPLAAQTVVAGGSATYAIDVTAFNGFVGLVDLTVGGLPTGASASFNPAALAGGATSSLTVTTATATLAGTYAQLVTGSSGTLVNSMVLTLIIP